MTEIPEHLLQRTRDRRIALGLPVSGGDATPAAGGGDGGGGAAPVPAAAAEAPLPKGPVAPPTPVDTTPAAPEPVPHYVEAYNNRKKIPVWAMSALIMLPLWAVLYAGTLEPAPSGELGLIEEGEVVYIANCASCHGATGGGGVGPQLSDGAVLETFPDPAGQFRWIYLGSDGGKNADGVTYGANNTTSVGGMPAFHPQLSDEEILAVVIHERLTLSGESKSVSYEGLHDLVGSPGMEAYTEEHHEELMHLLEDYGIGIAEEAEEATE